MTQMMQAFAKAALQAQATAKPATTNPISIKERVWNHIKAHPGSTLKGLRSTFKGVKGAAAIDFHLADLVARGMLESKYSGTKRKMGFAMVNDKTKYYYVIGNEFILREKKDPPKKVENEKPVEAPTPEKTVKDIIQKPQSPIIDIDNMKVKDARELFNNLKTIFGN